LSEFAIEIKPREQPLAQLRQLQSAARDQLAQKPLPASVRWVAGLDVSYAAEHQGVGGYALVDLLTGKLEWSATVACNAPFPYISSYLSFREIPVLVRLLEAARVADRLADVYMIDGAAYMHPRRIGVAAHFGVLADVPTIGVAKKHLAGSFDNKEVRPREPCAVYDGEELLGWAIRPRATSKRLVYVSAGHRACAHDARDVTLRLLQDHASPLPIYWADRLSRKAVAAQRG
jgi:deoxyribonuclease V